MNLSLKQAIVAIVVIAALLITLVGGMLRIEAAGSIHTVQAAPHSGHTLAWYCPAPPIVC